VDRAILCPMLGFLDTLHWLTSRTPQDHEVPREAGTEVHEAEPSVDVEPEDTSGLDTVSAWIGASSMASAQAVQNDVAFAVSLGLTRLDVIVNDHAAWREPTPFDTYGLAKIERLAEAVVAAGLELHYMSWLMPHAAYIGRAAEILVPLVGRTGARSIVWDAEEPYTQAKQALPYEDAAGRVASSFAGIQQGVTGIGYASVSKLGPLCSRVDLLIPQCYSSSTSGMSPATVVPRLAARWRAVFPGKPLAIGLAAYRQSGIPGFGVESAIRAAYGGAVADPTARVAIYWSLGQIRSNSVVTRTIRSLLLA